MKKKLCSSSLRLGVCLVNCLRWFFNFCYCLLKIAVENLEICISFHLIYFSGMFDSTDVISGTCSPGK